MNCPIYDCDKDTVDNCFGIIERGMRRLGIDPTACVSCLCVGTAVAPDTAQRTEERKIRAIARRGSYLISEHQVERIAALNAQGLRQYEIAAEIGCSQGTIAKHLAKLGYHRKPGRRAMAA